MANYLVTGGCGFIGSHLVDALLDKGHGVRILDDLSTGKLQNAPKEAEVVIGDVVDAKLVAEAMRDMDGCFHLAAIASVQQSMDNWIGTHCVNQTGAISVFDAARARGQIPARPVVFASSAAIYGKPLILPVGETTEAAPLSPYGADKYGCELHGSVAASAFAVPVTALRFFNVYGPRQDPNSPYSGVISIFARMISEGKPIKFFGDGTQSRDFIYVGDVVRHLLAAMNTMSADHPVFRRFNVCTGSSTTLLQLAHLLSELTGKELQFSHEAAREGDIQHSLGDCALAQYELETIAETSLREGLRRLLADAA